LLGFQEPCCHVSFLDLRNSPRASGDRLLAALAVPDSDRMSLDRVLAAESADVSGVLGDFHLLDLFSEGCTITSAVLAGHADLLCALRHFEESGRRIEVGRKMSIVDNNLMSTAVAANIKSVQEEDSGLA